MKKASIGKQRKGINHEEGRTQDQNIYKFISLQDIAFRAEFL
jgi:hypothetical protein